MTAGGTTRTGDVEGDCPARVARSGERARNEHDIIARPRVGAGY